MHTHPPRYIFSNVPTKYLLFTLNVLQHISLVVMQVSPSELEEVLLQHPKVKEVGVVGVPHDRLGEAPRAYVVTSSPANEKEIHE